MRDLEQERLDERYALEAEARASFLFGASLVSMVILGIVLAVAL